MNLDSIDNQSDDIDNEENRILLEESDIFCLTTGVENNFSTWAHAAYTFTNRTLISSYRNFHLLYRIP